MSDADFWAKEEEFMFGAPTAEEIEKRETDDHKRVRAEERKRARERERAEAIEARRQELLTKAKAKAAQGLSPTGGG